MDYFKDTFKKHDFKKRYWVFAFVDYSALGFLDDISFVSDDLEECRKYTKKQLRGWKDDHLGIFDSIERKIVEERELNQ